MYVIIYIYVMRNRAEQGCMENEFNGGQRICLDCLDDSDRFRHLPTYSDIFILTVGKCWEQIQRSSPTFATRTSMAWSAQVFTWSLRCSDGTENCSSWGGDRRIGTQLQPENFGISSGPWARKKTAQHKDSTSKNSWYQVPWGKTPGIWLPSEKNRHAFQRCEEFGVCYQGRFCQEVESMGNSCSLFYMLF